MLTGPTGAGKTDLLHRLAAVGEQVLDLEDLAGHRGSAFGALAPPRPVQPTNRAFTATVYDLLAGFDPDRPVWSEHKGVHVGSVSVPADLLRAQRTGARVEVVRDAGMRAAALVHRYGPAPFEQWLHALDRIRPRIGADTAERAGALLRAGRLDRVVDALLPYYDRGYRPHHAGLTGPLVAHADLDAAHAGTGGAPCRDCPRDRDRPPDGQWPPGTRPHP